MSETLVVGDLAFVVRRSTARRTVGITVERDGSLVLAAPEECDPATLTEAVRGKRFWIYTKLAQKELLLRPRRAREYVNGEGFLYLGRSYRLRLIADQHEPIRRVPLRLHQGRFELLATERERGRDHFIRWYREHATPWIDRRVHLLADRIGVMPGAVKVRDLGYRWGSCSANGDVNFHWRTILLPPSIVEYVVTHELIHLLERRHSLMFWHRLERVIPDFVARKQWLAEHGTEYDL